MGRSYFILSIVFLALVFTGCTRNQEEHDCISFRIAPVEGIIGPDTAAVNQEISLTVGFRCVNGCGEFGNFEKTTSGNTTTLSVIAKYQGCACTQEWILRPVEYKFKATQAGTYYLRLLGYSNNYLTHTITVQ